MSNPGIFFDIAKHNMIVCQFRNSWLNGYFEFTEMLSLCLSELQRQCNKLNDQYKLEIEPKLYHFSVNLFDKTELEKQAELINTIKLTDYVYNEIVRLAQLKQEQRIPVILQNKVTGEVAVIYKDEIEKSEQFN